MAINRKEIINRKNDGLKLIAFEYVIKGLQGPYGEDVEQRIWFEKLEGFENVNKPRYKVFTFIDDKVYEEVYEMPKNNMSIELITATGLNILNAKLQTELSYKEMLSFTIVEIVKDV